MILIIKLLAILGFLLSLYSLYVEWKLSISKNYKPLCDINNRISCTKAFESKYGHLFILPNPFYGLVFYSLVFILTGYSDYVFYLASASLIFSIYLAYISYFKQKNFCLVCTLIYLINLTLFLSSIIQF